MDESDTDAEDLGGMLRTLLTGLLTQNNDQKHLLNKLRGLVKNIGWKPTDASELFDALLKRFRSTTNDRSHLHSWMMEMLHCIESNYITPTWRKEKTLIELVRDENVTEEELKKCLTKEEEKTLEEILQEIRQQKLNQIDENLLCEVEDIVSSVYHNLTLGKYALQQTGLKKDLLRLCQAAEKMKFRPRLTQMVSLCIMALSKTGRLIQVGTGEGKSCIVAMFAAFRALRGEKVDIMSSSSVLAERDLNEWKDFYKELNVRVDCICNKQEEALKKCFECQVVYGTVEDFAGDWLRHNFQRKDIFGQRKFECAIVDEVDSLMLDKGLHVVYLSSEMPALQHLRPLLAFIWTTVNRYSKIGRETSVRSSILRKVAEEIKHSVRYTPCDLSQDKRICYVPGFLSDLVESKLEVWIKNAFFAQTMSTDHEYVIERHGVVPVDYSCTGVVQNNMKWTDGVQQFLEMKHGSKLSDMTAITNYMSNVGMLQKYGDQIFGISGTLGQQTETETLQKIYKGIQTCQIPSFKRRKLFEVDGVIVENDNKWIEKICDVVTTQTSPTPFRGQRAVLVICETISRAKVLHHALGDKVPNKELYISNNMDNTAIFAHKLEAGEVIIATNLAGRGTDLKVSEPVNTAGGLFVLQTFLPKNARVEAQAFGRTARQGAPGSAQLIVCSNHLSEPLQLLFLKKKLESLLRNIRDATTMLEGNSSRLLRFNQSGIGGGQIMSSMLSDILSENSNSVMKTVKKMRDDSVAEELASFLENDIPQIRKKEELFNQYLGILEEVYKSQDDKPEDSYVSALNEFWGMWRLTNLKSSESIEDLKDKLKQDLEKARQKLNQGESPLSNLHHYTAAGNELREKGHLAECIQLYTKAIETDRCWAAVAYYNRAFASLALQNGHQDPKCINQALEDLKNALKSVELYCEQSEVTCRYSRQPIMDLSGDLETRSDSHMLARKEALMFFKAHIYKAIEKVDRASGLGGAVKVKESLLFFLVPLVHFLPLLILVTGSLTQIRSRDPLEIQQLLSHPSFDIFHELRCLESLGLTHIYTLDTLFSLGGFFSKLKRQIFSNS
ncbi:protein translocase subunit SecA-like [Labrus mixtus]|uniref:protein translocase subunit SecA-like n=1 Tax=Labrus mixtus TaxID=508554 RepID=UPI0029C0BBBC|nr:protein translocase subunit SecA-like [Labrus mixtus]